MNSIKNRHQFRHKLRRIVQLFLVVISFLIVYRATHNVFTIKSIECKTQYGFCDEEMTQSLTNFINQPIFSLSLWANIQKELQKNLEVQSVIVSYKFPQSLSVSSTLRKPLAQIGHLQNHTFVISDETGLIIKNVEKSNLPLLISDQIFSPGDKLQGYQLEALNILNLVNQTNFNLISGTLVQKNLTINLSQGPTILLDLDKIPAQWYPTLQVILARSKILSKPPKVIDMRFTNPTLSF